MRTSPSTGRATGGCPTAITFHALGVVKRRHQGDADPSPPSGIDVERRAARRLDGSSPPAGTRSASCSGSAPTRTGCTSCLRCRRAGSRRAARTARPGAAAATASSASGRLVERKGVDTAVQALVDLPEAELVVAGGPDAAGWTTTRRPRLREVAGRAGVASRVRFVGRVQPDDAAGAHAGGGPA